MALGTTQPLAPEPAAKLGGVPPEAAVPGFGPQAVPGAPAPKQPLQMHPVTLAFQSPGLEAEYMAGVAKQRRPVLACLFAFDVACYAVRLLAHGMLAGRMDVLGRLATILPQMLNMIALHSLVAWVNWRARRLGVAAVRQEEVLLGVAVSLAIATLLLSLTPATAQDYVFAAMFLICASSFLKMRWLWGTGLLGLPLAALRLSGRAQHMPPDAGIHLLVAWAVGGLMSFLAEGYHRQMFANQQLARAAAEKEIEEAKARTVAQRLLADAQAQAAARALTVGKEKAANEAKSEFMSLMCHEVRTPLNGCLASAEMLLETKLEDEQRELAKTIRVSGSILLSTVSNFLDFFKMEAGKQLDIVRTEVELQELVSDVHCIIEAMIGRCSDVALMRPQLVDCPQYLQGDPDRLRGILLNLYTNAAKFTRTGAISLRVSVHARQHRPRPADHAGFYEAEARKREAAAHSPKEDGAASPQRAPSSGVSSSVEALLTSRALGDAAAAANGSAGGRSPAPLSAGRSSSSQASSISGLASEGTDPDSQAGGAAEGGEAGGGQAGVGGGWSRVVSSQGGVVSSSGSEGGETDEETQQWLFFEVADTGVGIGPKGLKSLFHEFVQGSEDDMKRPRSKGGTGLGLSICSKQVGVLGGRVGVLSKPGTGSIFWFCIPLRVPDPAAVNRDIELRRTASWGSRDAYTDGHLAGGPADGAGGGGGGGGGKRSTTARAHAFRKFHPAYQPSAEALSLARASGGFPAGAGDPMSQAVGVEECRRNSAPEIAEKWRRPGSGGGLGSAAAAPPVSINKQVQRLTQPAAAPRLPELRPQPESGTSAASFAVAKALLVTGADRGGNDSRSISRDMARASHDLRASLHLDRSQLQQAHPAEPMGQIREGGHSLDSGADGGGSSGGGGGGGGLANARAPSLDEVREAALSLDKISARRKQGHSRRGSIDATAAAAAAPDGGEAGALAGALLLPLRGVEARPRSMDRPRTLTQPPVPEDAELKTGVTVSPFAAPPVGSRRGSGGGGNGGRLQMRPSMEARWRQLDVSLLQGRRVLLAEDNLINQKVAQMMLTSLGMRAEVASNGQEALKLVLKAEQAGQQFHCVLMDMAMPVMGGVDATLAVRRAGLSVPIVAMTANASDRDRDECLTAGMDGFLSKPVLKDRLAEAIMRVVSGRGRYNADALVQLKSYEPL